MNRDSTNRKRERSEVEFDVDDFLAATVTQGTNLDSMILGIDEAGRGPVLGDMVYCGGMIALRHHNDLTDTGATDSKKINDSNRELIRGKLEKIPTWMAIEKPLSADDIADAMYSRNGRNLNTISHETAIVIIREATLLAKGKLCAVYVDTVGPPEPYQRHLQGRFPHLNITVAKKADSKYPVVSAASIIAKTTRDRSIAALAKQHGVLGSGYPGDQTTVAFVRSHAHRFFTFTPEYHFVRQSWGPVASIARTACVSMKWQHEEEAGPRASKGQMKLTDMKRIRRDLVYSSMLGFNAISSLDEPS
jgi:ribonuclease H2 subunit A